GGVRYYRLWSSPGRTRLLVADPPGLKSKSQRRGPVWAFQGRRSAKRLGAGRPRKAYTRRIIAT
ncbi:MAG: hypothetical protein M3Y56_13505, partial [Armatimonadota bacterium]|nr:hypothetical protein [Armatimonadota bacterium]